VPYNLPLLRVTLRNSYSLFSGLVDRTCSFKMNKWSDCGSNFNFYLYYAYAMFLSIKLSLRKLLIFSVLNIRKRFKKYILFKRKYHNF